MQQEQREPGRGISGGTPGSLARDQRRLIIAGLLLVACGVAGLVRERRILREYQDAVAGGVWRETTGA